MKKLQPIGIAILLLIVSTTFNACQKPEKGETGPAGANGNANVQSSVYYVSSYSTSGNILYTNIFVSDLTQDIVDNGAVLVYMETSSGAYSQLPITLAASSTVDLLIEPIHSAYNVQVQFSFSNNLLPGNPGLTKFKIVTIQGREMLEDTTINWKNYEEVKARLKLRD